MNMKNPTIAGIMVTFIWAYITVLVTVLSNLPPLEVLCFSTTIGFFLTSAQLTIQKRWHLIKASAAMWLSGSLCLFGMNVFYINAFHFAPPVHAEIINYIWPLFVAVGGAVFFKEKLTYRHIFGLVLCVMSLFVLHFDQFQSSSGIVLSHVYGYICALMAAVSCSVYILVSKKHDTVPSQIVGIYAGIGAVLSFFGHVLFEKTVVPSQFQLLMLLLLGASSHWLAYQLWDYAIKNLKTWKICVISYFTPVLSVIFLTLAGFGLFSWPVATSCLLLFAGSMLASLKFKDRL